VQQKLSRDSPFLSHPDHLGQRFGSHLLHHLNPMPFYGYFAGAQICGYLFVEPPTDYQPYYLSLARRQ
jgi:hypothetical protein